jgi:hypothetical protein
MIVAMRDNIKPLCDRHFSLMKLEGFAAQNIQLTFRAYVCKEPGCTRAYNSTIGYHDIIMNKGVSFAERIRRECPDDKTFMFVSGINEDSGEQTWTCAQRHCDHSEVVEPAKRTA